MVLKHEIKHHILLQLNDNQLVRINCASDIDKDEFEIKGIMYDVVRKTKINGQVVVWCFEDIEESQLNQRIEILVSNDSKNNPLKKTQQLLIQFLKIPLYKTSKTIFIFQKKLSQKTFFSYTFSSIISTAAIHSPPPDFR